MKGLFDDSESRQEERPGQDAPLAERMRPQTLDEYEGQEHIMARGKPLRLLIEADRIPSCILYGNPGTGKTTLIRLMAQTTGRKLMEINAVSAKISLLRELLDEALQFKRATGKTALAFVDEIYHFNTSQQNVLLPAVERGDVTLLGATSENPWFEINKTLLSRLIVYSLAPLGTESIIALLERALQDRTRGLGKLELTAERGALERIAELAGGDARQALTRLEVIASAVAVRGMSLLREEDADEATGSATQRYDRASAEHFSVISALIKSIRGSDPDAAVYWLARMLAAGDDPRFIARRLCILAAEDVGLADPLALVIATSASLACERVGMPEAKIILSEAVLYLSAAPKSNSACTAIFSAEEALARGDVMEVPLHLRNDGKGYVYPHDDPRHWTPQSYLPRQARFYFPGTLGAEARMAERFKRYWKRFSEES